MSLRSRPPLPQGPYLVAGLGRAGVAASDALLRGGRGPVHAWDAGTDAALRGTARSLRRRGATVALGGDGLAALEAAGPGAVVVKSPGIAPEVPLLAEAARRRLLVIDELELGWRLSPASIVGVTGTNGKSTTTQFCRAVVEAAGHSAELAGNTEFGPPLSAANPDGWVVCEVSSFQLEGSPSFLPDVAVFTNLTPDHLDRHGTMEAYGAAKRAMFLRADETAGVSVLNVDDPYGQALAGDVAAAGGRVLGYGFSDGADLQLRDASWGLGGARFRVGEATVHTRVPGRHNALNAAAALAVGEAIGAPRERTLHALSEADPPPGRWQLVDEGQPFEVIVDYAHTADGIRRLLGAVREGVAGREDANVITVFGPVGVPDPGKDLDSGRAAAELSDRVIVTTGSAGATGRLARIARVREGAGGAEVLLDRAEAITRAVEDARPGDVVVLVGLGHLRRQLLDAHTRHPHNDAEAARAALARVGAGAWS